MNFRHFFNRFSRQRFIPPIAIAVLLLTAIWPQAAAARPIPAYVKASVARGLRWLAHHQLSDGSFACASQAKPADAGLAAMAFMARGYTANHGPYHRVIDAAIRYILSCQNSNGYITSPGGTMYDQGICTVALTEVYGMEGPSMRKRVGRAIAKAVALILAAQKRTVNQFAGGWRYQPWSTDADISCTGWQLMALRGAADCGAAVPAEAIKNGIHFVVRDACINGGFAYQPGGPPGRARTGTGVLALELMGRRNSPQAISGGNYLLAHPIVYNENFYFYAVYYCSQAASQLGGRYWTAIYPPIRKELIHYQHASGCWKPPDGIEFQGGKPYATSMAILALCVPFHYLPLYQR